MLIQRTQFNKISIDRIEEVFAGQFAGAMDSYLERWNEWVTTEKVQRGVFYISVNTDFQVDGLLFHDTVLNQGTIFALSLEVTKELVTKAKKHGNIESFIGDPTSCKWVEAAVEV